MTKPTEDQQKAIDLINSGENVFLTGPGGVGKSYVIQQITDHNTFICAPTGIAALNVKGSTCHSLFHLPTGLIQRKDEVNISINLRKRFQNGGRVIIDEVSMLRADYLDLIDKKLKKIRKNNKPFGGLQVVVVGDFFQLPPIVSDNEAEYFYDKYDTAFAFGAKCWDSKVAHLNQVIRQSDEEQVMILNSIRKGIDVEEGIERLMSVSNTSPSDDALRLCCFNEDASYINKQRYVALDGDEYIFYADYSDNWGRVEPSPKTLRVKKGMKIIMTMNNPGLYTNGDMGVVESVDKECVKVRLKHGVVNVEPAKWEKHSYKKSGGSVEKIVTGYYEQLPMRYGWAVSIHKSQGMTLDEVVIDVGSGCFTHGQLYVALSRCKDLSKIGFMKPIKGDDVMVESDVKLFYSVQ